MMETDDRSPSSSDATAAFERDIEALVLSAYANGAAIEGEWHIEVPLSTAPSWTIIIEKDDDGAEPTYQPRFLTE